MSTPNEGTVGWRFSPKDEELINYFLRRKINGKDEDVKVIREIDYCKWEPWDLPGQSVLKSEDKEWFFFCRRDQKFPSSSRQNRATENGYWKATGKDRKIKSKKSEIGMKRTLVFHIGRAPKGKRTCWVMHEYRATLKELDGTRPGQTPYVLCRLFQKDDESLLDATDNDVESASLSTVPGEPFVMELKPEPVSHQTGSCAEQECEKALVDHESFKATSLEPQTVNSDYEAIFGDPHPSEVSLHESPTMESMGSSLPPHSASDDFYTNKGFQPACGNNKHEDFTPDGVQTFFESSKDYWGNQDDNWIENVADVSEYEFMNQFDLPGMDNGVFLPSNYNNMELSHLVAEREQYASNADSGPVPATNDSLTSFQEHDNSQTRPEYHNGAFLGGSSTNNDHATNTGIQIRRREPQPQATPDNSNFNKHGTAQRRIRLQTNLGRSLISAEPNNEVGSDTSKSKDIKQKTTKKFSSSLSSLLKPPSLTTSLKFIFGLASISLTVILLYAGAHYISSGAR